MQRLQDWACLDRGDVRLALPLDRFSDLVRLDLAVCLVCSDAVADNRPVRTRESELSVSALAERRFYALRRWEEFRKSPAPYR